MLYLLDVPIAWMGSITRFLTKLSFTSISDVVSITTSERGCHLNDCAFLHAGTVSF